MARTPQDKIDETFVATVIAILPPKLSIIGVVSVCKLVITRYLKSVDLPYAGFLLTEAIVEHYKSAPDAKRKSEVH